MAIAVKEVSALKPHHAHHVRGRNSSRSQGPWVGVYPQSGVELSGGSVVGRYRRRSCANCSRVAGSVRSGSLTVTGGLNMPACRAMPAAGLSWVGRFLVGRCRSFRKPRA